MRNLYLGDPNGPKDWDFVYQAFRNIVEASFRDDGTILGSVTTAIAARDALQLGGTGVLFADLPAGELGMRAIITDSDTVVWGAPIAGSGTDTVLAWFNGTDWTVIGK